MNIAQVSVMDRDYSEVWSGSLLRLMHDNCFSLAEAREHIAGLRKAQLTPNCPPEPYTVGGGAAEVFHLSLMV